MKPLKYTNEAGMKLLGKFAQGDVAQKLLAKHGQFAQVRYSRPLKLRKEFEDKGIKIVKATEINVRCGCEYDHLSSVKISRLNGSLPSENAGLINREWVVPNYVLRSKSNNELMFRLYASHPNSTPTHTFYLNNVVTTKEGVAKYVLSSEIKEGSRAVFDVRLSNIEWVHWAKIYENKYQNYNNKIRMAGAELENARNAPKSDHYNDEE